MALFAALDAAVELADEIFPPFLFPPALALSKPLPPSPRSASPSSAEQTCRRELQCSRLHREPIIAGSSAVATLMTRAKARAKAKAKIKTVPHILMTTCQPRASQTPAIAAAAAETTGSAPAAATSCTDSRPLSPTPLPQPQPLTIRLTPLTSSSHRPSLGQEGRGRTPSTLSAIPPATCRESFAPEPERRLAHPGPVSAAIAAVPLQEPRGRRRDSRHWPTAAGSPSYLYAWH